MSWDERLKSGEGTVHSAPHLEFRLRVYNKRLTRSLINTSLKASLKRGQERTKREHEGGKKSPTMEFSPQVFRPGDHQGEPT